MDNESNLFTVIHIRIKEYTNCYHRLRKKKEKDNKFSEVKKIKEKSVIISFIYLFFVEIIYFISIVFVSTASFFIVVSFFFANISYCFWGKLFWKLHLIVLCVYYVIKCHHWCSIRVSIIDFNFLFTFIFLCIEENFFLYCCCLEFSNLTEIQWFWLVYRLRESFGEEHSIQLIFICAEWKHIKVGEYVEKVGCKGKRERRKIVKMEKKKENI